MKKNIFLYLFVFTALIALLLFMRGNKAIVSGSNTIERLDNEVSVLRDSIESLHIHLMDMQYFSLENNDDALAYYTHLNLEDPSRYVADKLLETNEKKGEHPLIPYAGMDNDFKINKIKVLNHKWLLADFSDGKYWGDLIIKYELMDDLSVDFTLVDHLLYTRSH